MDSAMSRSVQQVIPEQLANFRQDLRITCRMQPVATIVEPLAPALEAAGVATNDRILLDDGDLSFAGLAKPVSRADPGRAGAEDHDPWFRHVMNGSPQQDGLPRRMVRPAGVPAPARRGRR